MSIASAAELRAKLQAALHVGPNLTLEDMIDTIIFQHKAIMIERYEVEHLLGVALGYPIGEEDGPCPGEPAIGDHTPVTLAMEVARRIGYSGGFPSAVPLDVYVGDPHRHPGQWSGLVCHSHDDFGYHCHELINGGIAVFLSTK